MFSGGIGSWAAAKRVVAQHGAADVTLLFTDTRMEDKDLYRFLKEGALNVGAPLVRLTEGRNPWHVMFDERLLGNSLKDPCSKFLKRQIADKWFKEHCDPQDTTIYVGIDWSEVHRYHRLRDRRFADGGWKYEAPMCDAPYLSKADMLQQLKAEGIRPPRLYELGFSHNNCGGFCVKAGQGHFANLLRTLPKRYAKHEGMEQAIRVYLGQDVSMMTEEREGNEYPLTLKDLRLRIEDGKQIDMLDRGGCGCFTDEEAA